MSFLTHSPSPPLFTIFIFFLLPRRRRHVVVGVNVDLSRGNFSNGGSPAHPRLLEDEKMARRRIDPKCIGRCDKEFIGNTAPPDTGGGGMTVCHPSPPASPESSNHVFVLHMRARIFIQANFNIKIWKRYFLILIILIILFFFRPTKNGRLSLQAAEGDRFCNSLSLQ